jgi:ribosome maturation factor RimP
MELAKRSKVAQEAFELAEPVVAELGFDLVDCSYVKESRGMVLTLYIDKRGGVGIDDCETVSRAVDPIFDGQPSIDPDFFEVSSPGLTRPLETEKDYNRYSGEKVDVSLYKPLEGKKSFTAVIKGADGDEATFVFDNGEELTLGFEDIAKAVRHIDF